MQISMQTMYIHGPMYLIEFMVDEPMSGVPPQTKILVMPLPYTVK